MAEVVRDGRGRSLAKAVSWRALGSVDTFVLSWIITGSPVAAGSIAGAETVTKVVLYYLHERAWSVTRWGRKAKTEAPAPIPSPGVIAQHAAAISARHAEVRLLGARRGRSTQVRRSAARASGRLVPVAQPPVPATSSDILRFPTTIQAPLSSTAASKPKVGLWLPAKIGVAGALCTYLALTYVPTMLERPSIQVPGSDLADTRPVQSDSEPAQVQLTEFRPEERPAVQVAAATPVAPEPARPQEPDLRETGVALPPQRPASDAATDTPQRDLSVAEQTEEVQRRLTRYGYLPAAPTGVWGTMSRQALRTFKAAHDLPEDDHWDQRTERVLFGTTVKPADSFVGIWGADASACSAQGNRKGLLPAVIDNQGAMAGETFCAFKDRVKTNEGWTFTATCTSPRERWTTKVRLETNGNKLTWASQRGNQIYTRCERRLVTADMTASRNR
jgi:uncharacterized membrane protein/peptidoglycan hydrolase-like protein with peptidoglycan-binding domain